MGSRTIDISADDTIYLSSKDVIKFDVPGTILKLKFGPVVSITHVDLERNSLTGSVVPPGADIISKLRPPIVHWVSGKASPPSCTVEIRSFDKLLKNEEDIKPEDISSFDADTNFLATINKNSCRVTTDIRVETNVVTEGERSPKFSTRPAVLSKEGKMDSLTHSTRCFVC